MKPTMNLRFVERNMGAYVQRVLQQWWEVEGWEHEDYVNARGEWQDVPLETGEQA